MNGTQTVYVVIKNSYIEGIMSYVFWNKNAALKYLHEDLTYEKNELIKSGYTPVEKENSLTSGEQEDNIYIDYWMDETEIN